MRIALAIELLECKVIKELQKFIHSHSRAEMTLMKLSIFQKSWKNYVHQAEL